MPSQEIQWLAIPFDVELRDGKTVLSVAVCAQPRLQDVSNADHVLSDYQDWIDWPATLKNIDIKLDLGSVMLAPSAELGLIDNTYTEDRTIGDTLLDDAQSSETWKTVFKPGTLVRPYEYSPFTDFKIISFPVKKVNETVRAMMVDLIKDFDGAPPVLDFSAGGLDPKLSVQTPKLFTTLKNILPTDDHEKQLSSIKNRWEREGEEAMARRIRAGEVTKKEVKSIQKKEVQIPSSPEQMMFANPDLEGMLGGLGLADLYHTARTYPADKVVAGKKERRIDRPKLQRPKFDFHQVVSVLREYPSMMRRLGLIKHVEFVLPNAMPKVGKIRCVINWPAPKTSPTKHITSWVAYALDNSGDASTWQFLPRPDAGSEIDGPLLCLDNASHFDVVQLDVDASAIKTLNFARAVVHRAKRTIGTADRNMPASPPSTRGTGLQLIRVNRGIKLAKSLIRNAQNYNRLIANAEITLYADDLLRGYRLDVYDETTGAWQSLMRRHAKYTFPYAAEPLKSTGFIVEDEEGVLTMGATRPVDSDTIPSLRQLYAHETIAQWEGWSLVAPTIGSSIDTDDKLQASSEKQKPPSNFEYQVETEMRVVPGSLPRLRFGRRYRMRARFVDIAGNGPKYNELEPLEFKCATELIRYMRWDPIVSPTLTLRKHPVEGEALERMVIRNYNKDDDDSVEVDTTESSERHMFPPLAAAQLAERHGMFDVSPTGAMKGDSGTYNMIKDKLKDLPSQLYNRNDAGDLVPIATPVPPAPPEPPPPDPASSIRYPLVSSGSTESPYLPDPLARGVTLANVPGLTPGQFMEITLSGENMATITSATGVVSIAFDDFASWPKMNSILVKLVSGNGAPTWDAGTKTLSIQLPKGEQAWIDFTSSLGSNQAEADANLDLHGHKQTLKDSGYMGAKMSAAARGLAWPVTPHRTLHLVHATQKPLKKPKVNSGSVTKRDPGSTNAEITLGDTYVHGRTTQKVDINTAWKMWEDNPQKDLPVLLDQSSYFYEQHVVDRTKDKLSNVKTQEFGDTKYRLVTYNPTATTRFREFIPLKWRKLTKDVIREGPGIELKILSTKRPDAAKLLYIIPSFRWMEAQRKLEGNIAISTRKGGGLRIFMERPWFSSGNDELLGIVLYSTDKFKPAPSKPDGKDVKGYFKGITPPGDPAVKGMVNLLGSSKLEIPDEIQPFVTQWGLDPIWLSAPTPSDNSPRPANFRDPEIILDNVSLAETPPSQRYTVVGYKPKFDKERKLWYCDIEIDPGESYFPFIRLSLCRLQPNSIPADSKGNDYFCSRVSQSEFCQLAPDRQATVRIEDDKQSVTVQVVGHTYRINTTGQLGSEMEVTVEKRDGSTNSDIAWTPVVTQRIDRIHAANIWGGLIKLPASVGSEKYRVVIKEYEQFFSDPMDPKERETSLGTKTNVLFKPIGSGEIKMELDRRIVYADVLPLF